MLAESVVDKKNEKWLNNVLHGATCAAREIAVMWMENKLTLNKKENQILSYINALCERLPSSMGESAMDMLYKPGSSITRLLVMLLVNLTQLDIGIDSLLQIGDEKMHGLYVMKLVRSFCTSSNETNDDPFDHVGSILVTISEKKIGKKESASSRVLLASSQGLSTSSRGLSASSQSLSASLRSLSATGR